MVYGAGLENLWEQSLRGSNPLPSAPCPRSLMDKTKASGALVGGSIPPGGTKTMIDG